MLVRFVFQEIWNKRVRSVKDPQVWCFFLGTNAGRRFGESLLVICRLAMELAPVRSRLVDRIAESNGGNGGVER